jgi:hypothetical protein
LAVSMPDASRHDRWHGDDVVGERAKP